jgi:hypothetical protein
MAEATSPGVWFTESGKGGLAGRLCQPRGARGAPELQAVRPQPAKATRAMAVINVTGFILSFLHHVFGRRYGGHRRQIDWLRLERTEREELVDKIVQFRVARVRRLFEYWE